MSNEIKLHVKKRYTELVKEHSALANKFIAINNENTKLTNRLKRDAVGVPSTQNDSVVVILHVWIYVDLNISD